MPLVTPTPIPPYPPAPQPTDDRVTFSSKAFSLASSYEPQRLVFNTVATEVYTNAQFAHERANAAAGSATLAGQKADIATNAVTSAQQTVADIVAVRDVIQTGGTVGSVNGRTGVVTGLVEQQALLPENANLDSVITSGFYHLPGAMLNGPFAIGVSFGYGQLDVSRGGDVVRQIASSTTGGNLFVRYATGVGASVAWSAWSRIFSSSTLLETFKSTLTSGAITADPMVATIHWIEPNGNVVITVPDARDGGEQMTLRLVQRGGYSFAFAGSNVRPAVGGGLPAIPNGQMLTVSLIGGFPGQPWWTMHIGEFHAV